MSVPDEEFSSPADRGAVLGTLMVLMPIAVIGLAEAAVRRFDAPSLVVLVLLFSALIWMTVLATRAAAYVKWSQEQVTVGLAPFWRNRLIRSDIVEVTVVRIDAYADYGGWGIKGSARSAHGRLYSVGGDSGVRILARDGRTFVIAFNDGETPARIRGALQSAD